MAAAISRSDAERAAEERILTTAEPALRDLNRFVLGGTMMKTSTRVLSLLAGGVAWTVASAVPALAQPVTSERPAAQQEREQSRTDRDSENPIKDSWITMKIHSQFIPEDALEDSDIDVDTDNGVVTLTGSVLTQAAKTRAVAIAKATDGVRSVNDQLRIGPAERYGDADARMGGAARETGQTAQEAGRETKEAGRSATKAVTDGWIKSKIASQFVTENALEDSDIDMDVERGVVTLTGTVRSEAGKNRAEQIAKTTDGVKSVKNNLRVSQQG
jgi:hyperosmotically inducible protein